MGSLHELREYVAASEVKHVTFSATHRTQVFACNTCGDLPVIHGIVIHTRPDEDHEKED